MGRMSQAMNIIKMGAGGVGMGGKALWRGGMPLAWNAVKGMGTFWSVRDMKKKAGIIGLAGKQMFGRGVSSEQLLRAGKASANLLGKGSGIVMGARIIGGKSPFRDSAGRRDIPFVPFI